MEAVWGKFAVQLFFVMLGSRLTALTNQAQKAKGSQGNANPSGRGAAHVTQDFWRMLFSLIRLFSFVWTVCFTRCRFSFDIFLMV